MIPNALTDNELNITLSVPLISTCIQYYLDLQDDSNAKFLWRDIIYTRAYIV